MSQSCPLRPFAITLAGCSVALALMACGSPSTGPDQPPGPKFGVLVETDAKSIVVSDTTTVTVTLGTREPIVSVPLCDGKPAHVVEAPWRGGWANASSVFACSEADADRVVRLFPASSFSFDTDLTRNVVVCGVDRRRFRVQVDPSASSASLRTGVSNEFELTCS